MAVTRQALVIHYEDGTTAEALSDQRDMAAFEVAEKRSSVDAFESCPMLLFRFLGWHALRRTGQVDVKETREAWGDRVIEVEPVTGADADPGKPEA
jgi:hypothetical protein